MDPVLVGDALVNGQTTLQGVQVLGAVIEKDAGYCALRPAAISKCGLELLLAPNYATIAVDSARRAIDRLLRALVRGHVAAVNLPDCPWRAAGPLS